MARHACSETVVSSDVLQSGMHAGAWAWRGVYTCPDAPCLFGRRLTEPQRSLPICTPTLHPRCCIAPRNPALSGRGLERTEPACARSCGLCTVHSHTALWPKEPEMLVSLGTIDQKHFWLAPRLLPLTGWPFGRPAPQPLQRCLEWHDPRTLYASRTMAYIWRLS
ncbi:hypothetical protein IQ07DRAFT_166578 [Pyrenochaeta sp. DS3sAY3a]|nr:hypothetical protein IQ07DRAFT_166578 [Pyrenochaeta sp. DS3sAY3a]